MLQTALQWPVNWMTWLGVVLWTINVIGFYYAIRRRSIAKTKIHPMIVIIFLYSAMMSLWYQYVLIVHFTYN